LHIRTALGVTAVFMFDVHEAVQNFQRKKIIQAQNKEIIQD
jgi:hypothetical protein